MVFLRLLFNARLGVRVAGVAAALLCLRNLSLEVKPFSRFVFFDAGAMNNLMFEKIPRRNDSPS